MALEQVMTIPELLEARRAVVAIHVDPKIDRYIVSLVHASRDGAALGLKGMIEWGASPRAGIALRSCARSLAFLRGRSFVTPDEVKEVAPDVLRHRILTSFEAEARGTTSDDIIAVLLRSVTIP